MAWNARMAAYAERVAMATASFAGGRSSVCQDAHGVKFASRCANIGSSYLALYLVLSLAVGCCSFMFAYIEDLLQRRDFEERHR